MATNRAIPVALARQAGAANPHDAIIVVSGLPRSGTSMLMHLLQAGGIAAVTDHARTPDVDNPQGYYEFERVKRLPQGDVSWLDDARGKSVKVISALLIHLPPSHSYRVIFMHRRLAEVLDSQRKMLEHRGEASGSAAARCAEDDAAMAALLQQHVADVRAWVVCQPNIAIFDADYNAMLSDPAPWMARINAFLGGHLDVAAMQAAVDANLYRNRA